MSKFLFAVFPVAVLVVSILMQGGNLMGATQNVCYNINQNQCSQNGHSVTFSCSIYRPGGGLLLNLTPCQIAPTCDNMYPSPAYCFFGVQYINPGDTLTTTVLQTSSQGFFAFGSIGFSGVVAMIGVAVAVSVLAGFNILGSGLNTQSIKIMFMGGLLSGAFLFVAGLEGFINGSSLSFFSQINAVTAPLIVIPLGTVFYIVLTFSELYGIAGFVSGGDAG